jgi:hypothetical protein
MREAGGTAEAETDFARRTFVWNPSLTRRAVQIARHVKWRAKYAAWKLLNPES